MSDLDFDKIYNILNQSFPSFLHRGYERQKQLLNNPNYNIITYRENSEILGFLAYWKIKNDLYFVEHFAVLKEKRGTGIGRKIFNEFLSLKGEKFLETEPPNTEINKKRIMFYEKLGLIFHKNEYYQPPYNKKDKKVRLHIMCTSHLENNKFDELVNELYSLVYDFK